LSAGRIAGNIYNIIFICAMSLAIWLFYENVSGFSGGDIVFFVPAFISAVICETAGYFSKAAKSFSVIALLIIYILCGISFCLDEAGTYKLLISALSGVTVTIICCIIYRIKYVKRIVPLLLLVCIIAAKIIKADIAPETVVLVIYVSLMTVCGIKSGATDKGCDYSVYMTPVIFVFCAALYMIPVSEEPLSWKTAKKVINVVYENVSDTVNDAASYMGFDRLDGGKFKSGYNDTKKLGVSSRISGNNSIQMCVMGRQSEATLYLRGSEYNIFDGKSWRRKYTVSDYPEREVQLYELTNALSKLDDYKDYIKYRKITITHEEIRTKTVFSPLNVVCTDVDDKEAGYNNGVLEYESFKGRDNSYKVWYFDLDCDNLFYNKLYGLRAGTNKHPKVLKNFIKHNLSADISLDLLNVGYELLEGRGKYIEDNYMKLPDAVTDRMYSLAEEITDGRSNDYFKAKAIEQYLKKFYEYDKSVPENESGDCYIDTFLFETKKGSCMHFASAAAILARCIDIPSRVVTGFAVHYKEAEGKNVKHYVAGSDGHAWTEVYIKGVGWMKLEPTPVYNSNAYVSWNTKTPAYASGKTGGNKVSGDNNNVTESTNAPKEPDKARPQPSAAAHTKEDSVVREEKRQDVFVILLVLPVIALLTVAVIIFVFKRIRYAKADNFRKCRYIINEIMRRYRRKTGISCNNKTLNESVHIMSDWLGDEKDNYIELITAYQGYVFGRKRIDNNIVRKGEHILKK